MKTLQIGILDDEKHALDIVSASVKSSFESRGIAPVITCFSRGEDLLKEIQSRHFDLLFLDISMPDLDGVEVGKRIAVSASHPDIVYVSSNNDRVFETFSVTPFGFVRKDVFIQDLANVVERYVKKIEGQQESLIQIEVKSGSGLLSLDASQILYVECFLNNQTFVLASGEKQTIHSRMDILEAQLTPLGFIRVHKGYLVNAKAVKRFKTGLVELVNGDSLPVGRTKQEAATKQYLEYLKSHGIAFIG